MKKNILGIVLLLFIYISKAQSGADSVYSKTVKEQGDTMANLLLRKDYKNFVEYLYPDLIKQAGGKSIMAGLIEEVLEDQENKGFVLTGAEVEAPLIFVKTSKDIQCVVTQTLTMKVKTGHVVARSSLIGISVDQGKNWKFLDTQGKSIQTLHRSFPALSLQLVIPENDKPVFYRD